MFSRFKIDIEKMPEDAALPKRLPRLYWHFIVQVWPLVLLMIGLCGVVAVMAALLPYFAGRIVDMMAAGGDPATIFARAAPLLTVFIVLYLVLMPITGIASQYTQSINFTPRFGNMIRRQAHWYVLRHALSYFQNDFAGRLANKVFQMGPAISDALTQFIGAVFFVLIFFVSSVVLMMRADLVFAVPMAVWLSLYGLILALFVPQVQKKTAALSESHSRVMGRIVDSYTNIITVKLFSRKNHEDRFVLESLHAHSDRIADKNMQVIRMLAALSFVNGVMIVLMTFLCLWLWSKGVISTGEVAMILPLVVQINGQMHWIMWETTAIFEWIGMAEDSMETVAVPHSVTDAPGAQPLSVTRGAIDFEGVSFHYGRGDGVIDNLTLSIPPGQKVGLVGRSGAGKSTLVNLLLRFYDLERGRILVDGQDIAVQTQDTLRGAIAMVTQDTSLLHRSLIDNIRYGRPDASMEEIIAAAKKAQAHEFIEKLEDSAGRRGYEAHVGERGVKLSGGQRQRIAIARIILKNAPILILDEATSALDSEVESYIQQQLVSLMEGKTVIAIAHRLSTIARMDRLVVLEEGRVVEDGTHADLIRSQGHYARLWALQSGGFLPD